MALKDLHLADLHERARELEVPGYRLLPRDELIEAIEQGESEGGPAEAAPAAGERDEKPREQKPRRGRRREPRERADAAEEEAETEEVTGVLDRMPQGYGFLRLGGLEPAEGDVYVSASQIRRCELRPGDEVTGPARAPRRGERHRALVRVASVNGQEPEGDRTVFEDLTPKAPHRPLLPPGSVELSEPLSFGHRVLVEAEESPAACELMRALGAALAAADARLAILVAGQGEEAAAEWERLAPDAEIVGHDDQMEPRERVRAAELAMGRAKRGVEAGEDVVVIIDSLSALALGYRDPSRVKRLFGSGRELAEEGSGSLTVIAAVIAGDERAQDVKAALEGTEDVLLEPS